MVVEVLILPSRSVLLSKKPFGRLDELIFQQCSSFKSTTRILFLHVSKSACGLDCDGRRSWLWRRSVLAQVLWHFAEGLVGCQLPLPPLSAPSPGTNVRSAFVFVWACAFVSVWHSLPQVHMQLSSCANFFFFVVVVFFCQYHKFALSRVAHLLKHTI